MKKNKTIIGICSLLILLLVGCTNCPTYQDVYQKFLDTKSATGENVFYAYVKIQGCEQPMLFVSNHCYEVLTEKGKCLFSSCAEIYKYQGRKVKYVARISEEQKGVYCAYNLAVDQQGFLYDVKDAHDVSVWAMKRGKLVLIKHYNDSTRNSELQDIHSEYRFAQGISFLPQ